MKQTLTFNRSIITSTASKIDVESFDKSLESFDKKEYLDSFYFLLRYINPEFKGKYGNKEGTKFDIPHGSIVVHIEIEDNQLKITAPFLSLPENGRIPLLRQIAVLNFNHMNLAQITMKDNRLFFEYTCPLELAEQYKIYYTLEDICYTGDKYDDEFVTKFGAQRIYEPKITPYDAALVDAIYNTVQLSCAECMNAVQYFEGQRKFGYEWNVLICTIYKVLYYAHPQGQLLNDLNKAVNDMNRSDIPLADIVEEGKKVIAKLQSMPKEELAKELYFIEIFIPPKRRSILKNIQDNFEETFDDSTSSYESGDYMSCSFRIIYEFYRLYFYNNVQDDLNHVVVKAMEKSSAKPWEEAAPILLKAMKKIMDGELDDDDDDDGGEAEFDMSAYMNTIQQGMDDFAKNLMSMFGKKSKK
jgi:hypothetical protein